MLLKKWAELFKQLQYDYKVEQAIEELNNQIQKQEEMKPAQPEAARQEYDEDEISLGDLFSTIWRARSTRSMSTRWK